MSLCPPLPSRLWLPVCLLVFAAACARHGATEDPLRAAGLTLSLAPDKPACQPGEPVRVMLTLANAASEARELAMPSHATVAFAATPLDAAGAPGEMRLVEPVFSVKEPDGERVTLAPAGAGAESAVQRTFIFTTLSLESGRYRLAAVYAQPAGGPLRPAIKAYAAPTSLTVAGDKIFCRRYLNGLLTRDGAVGLATARAGGKARAAEALLVTDPAGFARWWVNVEPEGAAAGTLKSFFVDPVFARVEGEARPFTAADKGGAAALPEDAKVLQSLRAGSARSRMQ